MLLSGLNIKTDVLETLILDNIGLVTFFGLQVNK